VFLHPTWFVGCLWIGWLLVASYPAASAAADLSRWASMFFTLLLLYPSVLAHEAAHVVVAARRGVALSSITVFLFGAVCEMGTDPVSPECEVAVAAAGPLLNLGISLVFGALSAAGVATAFARALALANLALGVYSLVPVFPLDGARVLRGLLWRRLGKPRATSLAASAGRTFAGLLLMGGGLALMLDRWTVGALSVLVGLSLARSSRWAFQSPSGRPDGTAAKVSEVMVAATDVAEMPAYISLAEAERAYLSCLPYEAFPAMRGARVVGLLLRSRVARVPTEQRESMTVQSIMLRPVQAVAVAPTDPMVEACDKMDRNGVGCVLVLEGDRLCGLVTQEAVRSFRRTV
jgi:Zn-dependent protease